ncbi:sulfatase family protein [Pseudoteredinibacter isoporae]|uniref:sulfatase family protein n=1 Tax=Pseudoteredinibacter isoporae TaxID=570281 RepID=UPI003106ACB3
MMKCNLGIVFAMCLSLLGMTGITAAESVKRPPNVIVILTDDLGYGDLGSYGNEVIDTPNLDQMANEGVRFTNAYASASNCTPSRAGLLTGRYPIRSGMAHQVLFVNDTHGLPLEEITIAEMLKESGYQTAIIGKWHLGHTETFWPTQHGFDYYYGLPYSNNQNPLALYRNRQKIEEPVVQQTLTQRYTSEAINFIRDNKDRPFFIYIAHTFPHVPLYASEDFVGKSEASLYGDVVEELDWSTGAILKSLKAMGLDQNTLVIFTSDNGPYQGGVTAGLRSTKGTAWEGGYRVPFIARWPGEIPENKVSNGISMNIDLLPTIATITRSELPKGRKIDGRDITSMLKGSHDSPHEKLYFFADDDIAAVRTQNWKAVLSGRYRGVNRWFPDHDLKLLFDMNADPQERYSVESTHKDQWEKMMRFYREGRKEFGLSARHKSR